MSSPCSIFSPGCACDGKWLTTGSGGSTGCGFVSGGGGLDLLEHPSSVNTRPRQPTVLCSRWFTASSSCVQCMLQRRSTAPLATDRGPRTPLRTRNLSGPIEPVNGEAGDVTTPLGIASSPADTGGRLSG